MAAAEFTPYELNVDAAFSFEAHDGSCKVTLCAGSRILLPLSLFKLIGSRQGVDEELSQESLGSQYLCSKVHRFLDNVVWIFVAASSLYANPNDALVEMRQRFSGAYLYLRPFDVGSQDRSDEGEKWRFKRFLNVCRLAFSWNVGPGQTVIQLDEMLKDEQDVTRDTLIVAGMSLNDFVELIPKITVEHFSDSEKMKRQKAEKEKNTKEMKTAAQVLRGKMTDAMVIALQTKRLFASARKTNTFRLLVTELTGLSMGSVGRTRADTLKKLTKLNVPLPDLTKIMLNGGNQTCYLESDPVVHAQQGLTHIGVAFDMTKQVH